MITGVDHIAMIVSSEESIAFYSKLGFTETFRKERSTDTIVLMSGYGINLEMFVDASHPKRAEHPENIGMRHLALKVADLDEIITKFECGPVNLDWVGKRYCFTSDPDGLPIEFHE